MTFAATVDQPPGEPTSCRTCGAPIFLARFKQKWVELNWQPSTDGRWAVMTDDESRLRARLLSHRQQAADPTRVTFMSHRLTCDADPDKRS
ncbi:hypothetical protein [Gordonia malaquae]|uniref:hypothetical protein n=1 Tax=Gordonia malaquae TaxID=410332 RepID=UPI0030FE41AF